MLSGTIAPLLSLEASRPAFMIVMGLFLLVVAWRLARDGSGWASKLLVSGATMLAFGYAVIVPLHESGMVPRFRVGAHIHGDPTVALFWHVAKLFAMNAGWFLFGLGLVLHARVFARTPVTTPDPTPGVLPASSGHRAA